MTLQQRIKFGRGSENLRVMEAAINYHAYLLRAARCAMVGHHRVLDFGAGFGTLALGMRGYGHELVCVEPEPALRTALTSQGFDVYASINDVPDKSADGFYAINVLEHIDDDESALVCLRRKLTKGGRFYAYVPAFQILYSAMDYHVGHFRRYRLGELVDKFRRSGFRIENAGYADSLGFFAALLYKATAPGNGDIPLKGLVFYDRFAFPISCAVDALAHRLFGKNAWVTGFADDT